MTKPAGYEWGPWLDVPDVAVEGCIVQFSSDGLSYRVQIPDTSEPEPAQTKPYVDPDWLSDWVQWIARDKNGGVYAYRHKPYRDCGEFYGSRISSIRSAIKHEKGTCDWKDSRVSREELEAEKMRRDPCEKENDFAMWGEAR